jgi:basic amino acid/polyamine antiporter, APA family
MNWRTKSVEQCLALAEKRGLTRTLGPFQLTMLGIGAIIGTGIFVLTAEAAQKAGPAMMISFIIAAIVCALAALAYAELAAMVPVAGSAYTYTYGVLGELLAWIVGWALVLEYAVAAGAVAVGWSGYMNGWLEYFGVGLPQNLRVGPYNGGTFNLLAFFLVLFITLMLVLGTSKSAKLNAVLVAVKVIALTAFIIMAFPAAQSENFQPFLPAGWGDAFSGMGVLGAAASIFFAYVGFDAVSTAAEETRNPNRNVPIGLIGSLGICTIFYLLVGYASVGAPGAQPIMGPDGHPLETGSAALAAACTGLNTLVCSHEPLAHVIRSLDMPNLAWWIGTAAAIALPSVVLMMLYGQTRIFFTMSRDGLLPEVFSRVHPRFQTPHVVTIITGIAVALFAAMFPVGLLADISNSGTLFAFLMVSIGVLILRRTQPDRPRPFRTPAPWIVCPLAAAGCLLLFVNLSSKAQTVFLIWGAFGLVIYFLYGYRNSPFAKGTQDSV